MLKHTKRYFVLRLRLLQHFDIFTLDQVDFCRKLKKKCDFVFWIPGLNPNQQ